MNFIQRMILRKLIRKQLNAMCSAEVAIKQEAFNKKLAAQGYQRLTA